MDNDSKERVGHWIMSLFRNRDKYSDLLDPPNHAVSYGWNPYPVSQDPTKYWVVLNSESPSDEVWLGSDHKWFVFYSGAEFRRIAAWVLWKWVWGDWCGLKTKLWLIGLHLAVSSYRPIGG